MEQIRSIKEKALGTKDEEQVEYLTSVLDALTTCVSSLHEREHESLLNEVFGISIWQATPVRTHSCFLLHSRACTIYCLCSRQKDMSCYVHP